MLGQFIKRCLVYRLHLKTAFTVYSERNSRGADSFSFIGAMQTEVRNTYSNQQSATYFTTPNTITPRQIDGTNLPAPKGWIAWLAGAHVYVHNLLRVITRLNPAARVGIKPRWTGPRSHSMPMNQPLRTLQVEIVSHKTVRSAVGVEPATFQIVATDNYKDWRLYYRSFTIVFF